MGKEINLESVNSNYPCDLRQGYGRGCKCKNNGLDTQLIRCGLNSSNVRQNQCEMCKYQQKYETSIKNESTE